MSLVALALVLSLVAVLAPDASAQDDAAPAIEPSRWIRYNLPIAQPWQAGTNVNTQVAEPKNCCITISGPIIPTGPVIPLNSGFVANGDGMPRWFCIQLYR